MPKSQYIDPTQMRKPGEITFTPIPVNQYNKTVKDELKAKHFTKDDLKRIYRDMVVIREFETMLQLVKTTGGYNGVEYNNLGPATCRRSGSRGRRHGLCSTSTISFSDRTAARRNSRQGLRAIELLDDKSLRRS
ncbi:MAG: hypothetical protein ACLTTP_02245 [Alistipes ihumii]